MLPALRRYAERRGLAVEPGFKTKLVRWLLVFNEAGGFVDARPIAESGVEAIPGCPDLTTPEMRAAGEGCRHFLVDSLEVIAHWVKTPDPKMARKHDRFVGLLEEAAAEAVPELGPLARALRTPETRGAIHAALEALGDPKPKPTDAATLATRAADGTVTRLVDGDGWRDWWRGWRGAVAAKRAARRSGERMRCLATGELVVPAPTHDAVPGLRNAGGRDSGDALASFKQPSFSSHGLAQAANAAMGAEAVASYAAALGDLLRTRSRRIAGSMVARWLEGDVPEPLDPFRRIEEAEIELDPDGSIVPLGRVIPADLSGVRWNALTLGANSGRIIVRDHAEGALGDLAAAVDAWFADLDLVGPFGDSLAPRFRFEAVATCPLPDPTEKLTAEKYLKWTRPLGDSARALWRCALGGREAAIPDRFAAMVLERQRAAIVSGESAEALRLGASRPQGGGPVAPRRAGWRRFHAWAVRMAVLKAHVIRSGGEMGSYLNEDHPSPAYHAGRLLATMQHIQSLNGTPKSSFLDKFYGACSVNPALVLPRIWAKAQKHLTKAWRDNPDAAERLWNLLREAHAKLGDGFPAALDPTGMSEFQLGFFQQQQFLPKPGNGVRVKTDNGELVRSKSEALIANKLKAMGVAYEYEAELVIDGEKIWLSPDFTIKRGESPPVYLEHLGLMGKKAYRDRWADKLVKYRNAGIWMDNGVCGENGALTSTTEEDVKDPEVVERIIREALASEPAANRF